MSKKESQSEFGKGLCYCLGLFLAHADRIRKDIETYKEIKSTPERAIQMWFYGAADHLFEFQADQAPKGLKKRCRTFQDFVLERRMIEELSKEDFDWAIQEGKDLLRLIDQKNGIETDKGQFE